MNMNFEGFEKSCLELAIWGEAAGDVYGGEDCREYAAEKCGMQKEELTVSLLRMQLEQERFFRLKSAGRAPESLKEARLAAERDVLRNLQERFSHCPKEERQGILLHMLEGVLELNGHSVTEEERAGLVRMPADRLESWLAAEIVRCAEMLFAEKHDEAGHGDGGSFAEEKKKIWMEPYLAGAVMSVAAYMHCPELRSMPELIADACAGAAFVAEYENDGREGEILCLTVCVMLLEAALLLTCLLLPASPGTACMFLAGAGLTLAGARELFLSYMDIFSVSLTLVIGREGADLAAKAAAYLAELSSEEDLAGNAEWKDTVFSWLEERRREPGDGEESEESEENEEEQEELSFRERA